IKRRAGSAGRSTGWLLLVDAGRKVLVLHLDPIETRIRIVNFPFERIHAALGGIGLGRAFAIEFERGIMARAGETRGAANTNAVDRTAQMRTDRGEHEEVRLLDGGAAL